MTYLVNSSLYIVSGILLGVGFLFPSMWLLSILGVSLYLYILQTSAKVPWWGSFLTWTIKFLFVLGFYWSLYPIKWLPFDFGTGELALVGLYWVSVSVFLGSSGLVFVSLYALSKGALTHTKWLAYLLIPFMWVIAEIAGSLSLSVFTLGPGSEINTYFSLGYIGLLLAHHPLLVFVSAVGGVYSLSFATVVLGVYLSRHAEFLLLQKYKLIIVPVCILSAVGVTSLVSYVPSHGLNETKTVAVVSTWFPVERMFERTDVLKDMQAEALSVAVETNAEYIILPEDGRFFDQTDDGKLAKDWFRFRNSSSTSIIIDSGRVELGGKSVLQGFIFDTGTGESSTVHKKYLVPQGEFVPYIYEYFFRLIGFGSLIDELTTLVSYRIGPLTSQAELSEKYPGLLFCFENASAVGVRDLLKERPALPFIAHPVSHSWFNHPQSFWSQLEQALRVQAIWNKVAIVSAGNHAPSRLFLPNGEVVEPTTVASGEYWSVGIVEVPIK